MMRKYNNPIGNIQIFILTGGYRLASGMLLN